MKANQFTVASTWQPRKETPETLGRRTLTTLDALTRISPYFRGWRFADLKLSVEDMLDEDPETVEKILQKAERPLEDVRDRMAGVVENGVRRDDFGEPEPEGGYSITAFSDNSNPWRHVTFSAHGGGIIDPRAGLRFAQLETAHDRLPDPAIVSYEVFRSVLTTIASAWEVEYAQAYSNSLRERWHQPYPYTFDLAWMTYLSPKLAHRVAPPLDVLTERGGDGGLLMIAAEETFNASNTKHMAAARSIRTSLAGLNAEM